MATKEQLRKLRQKYHLGEYKRNNRKVYKHHAIRHNMAKRRRSYRRSGGSSQGVWSLMLGSGVYVLFEQYLEPMIPLQEPMLSVAELAVSYWMSKKGGMVGNIGKAGMYINTYQIMKYFASTTLPNISGGAMKNTVTDMFAY